MTTAAAPDLYVRTYRNPYDLGVAKRVLKGIQELRLRLKECVDLVVAGTHIVFTRHGRPTAVLVPMDWYRQAAEAIGDPTEL